jgi:group I intron endonuclease
MKGGIILMKEIICGVYKIENALNNKMYIGQSIDVHSRWGYHIRALNNGTHYNDHLQRAWNKYGQDNFVFSVIERCSELDLDNKEMYYISKFDTTNCECGYNLTFGGEGGVPTDEVRAKKSRALSGENNPMFGRIGELNPVYGTKKTAEQIQNMIDSRWTDEKRHENSCRVSGRNNPMFGKFGSLNPASRAVICIETGELFESAKLAAKWCNLKSSPMIGQVCLGYRKSAGKHPITGEKLHWKYAEYITNQCESNEFAL